MVSAMSKLARIYIGLTIASAAILIAACAADAVAMPHSARYLGCCLLALAASTLKVRLPGIHGTISLNFLFVLIAVAAFAFSETVLLAALACLLQCFWKARRRPRAVQVAFNVSALALSSGVAYRFGHLAAKGGEPALAILLAVGSCVYFTSNTLLVSGVLALIERKSLFGIWRECYLWSFPYYLAGAALAGLMVSTGRTAGWAASLMTLPSILLVYVFYRIFVARFGGAESPPPSPALSSR